MVKRGERYRHYKGKVVEVVRIIDEPPPQMAGDLIRWAPLQKIDLLMDIIKEEPLSMVDNTLCATLLDDNSEKDSLVVYKEENCSSLWARPLRIFEEVLGETTKFYRFEKTA